MNAERFFDEIEEQSAMLMYKLGLLYINFIQSNFDHSTIHYIKFKELKSNFKLKLAVLD